MKVKALRGVCIGVERHMKPGDVEDVDPATVTFLTAIGAVERVPDQPVAPPVAELDLKSEADPATDLDLNAESDQEADSGKRKTKGR